LERNPEELEETLLVSSRYRQLQLTVQKATPCSRDFIPETKQKGAEAPESCGVSPAVG